MQPVIVRNAINGGEFVWRLFRGPRKSTTIKTNNLEITATGGSERKILSATCRAGDVPVNLTLNDHLIGADWMDGDFTDPIRIEFTVPVKAVGVQFAVTSDIASPEFTALIRASIKNNNLLVPEFLNDKGVSSNNIGNNSAIFLGVVADGAERINVIRVDVRPRGNTIPNKSINRFYINQLIIEI